MIIKNPEIVDSATLKNLVSIKKNNFLQQKMKAVFLNYITATSLSSFKEKENLKILKD